MTTPEEPNAVDDIADASALLDQWDKKLKEAPGDADAKAQLRNWAIPMFRKLISIVEAVAGELVEDAEEQMSELTLRVDEVSGLARATLATHGMVQVLAQTHEVCRRLLSADIGEETQEMAQVLMEITAPHAAAVSGAVQGDGTPDAVQGPPNGPEAPPAATEAPPQPTEEAEAPAAA
jgi:hypothetical protein